MEPLGKKAAKILAGLQDEQAAAPAALPLPPPSVPNKYAAVTRSNKLGEVLLSEIIPDPSQVRQTFDEAELEQMTASIKAKGILTPLRVRWLEGEGKWQAILGGKRLKCAQRAGLLKAPCELVDGAMSRADCIEEQIAENEHRSPPPPLETAAAWQELLELRGWTQEQLAERLHLSQGRVSRTLKLLKLPEWMQAEVKAGKLPPEVAVEMGKIKDPAEQENMRGAYESEGVTREEVKKIDRDSKRKNKKRRPKLRRVTTIQVEDGCTWTLRCKDPATDDDVQRLARMLVEHLHADGQGRVAA